ncbi:MAG TPA: hypothetical protein VFM56_02715 [Solimonas sp.]|nr:hypothetical protein [Solimonas sp.]
MDKPLFMSPQHVETMNRLLDADAGSRAECAKLDRRYWLVYELADRERTVWWSVAFDPQRGVRFSLAPPAPHEPAMRLCGEYRAVVQATQRIKRGEAVDEPVTTHDEAGVLAIITPAFAAAGRAATIATTFPTF